MSKLSQHMETIPTSPPIPSLGPSPLETRKITSNINKNEVPLQVEEEVDKLQLPLNVNGKVESVVSPDDDDESHHHSQPPSERSPSKRKQQKEVAPSSSANMTVSSTWSVAQDEFLSQFLDSAQDIMTAKHFAPFKPTKPPAKVLQELAKLAIDEWALRRHDAPWTQTKSQTVSRLRQLNLMKQRGSTASRFTSLDEKDPEVLDVRAKGSALFSLFKRVQNPKLARRTATVSDYYLRSKSKTANHTSSGGVKESGVDGGGGGGGGVGLRTPPLSLIKCGSSTPKGAKGGVKDGPVLASTTAPPYSVALSSSAILSEMDAFFG